MNRNRRPPGVEEALSSMLWTPYERTPTDSSEDELHTSPIKFSSLNLYQSFRPPIMYSHHRQNIHFSQQQQQQQQQQRHRHQYYQSPSSADPYSFESSQNHLYPEPIRYGFPSSIMNATNNSASMSTRYYNNYHQPYLPPPNRFNKPIQSHQLPSYEHVEQEKRRQHHSLNGIVSSSTGIYFISPYSTCETTETEELQRLDDSSSSNNGGGGGGGGDRSENGGLADNGDIGLGDNGVGGVGVGADDSNNFTDDHSQRTMVNSFTDDFLQYQVRPGSSAMKNSSSTNRFSNDFSLLDVGLPVNSISRYNNQQNYSNYNKINNISKYNITNTINDNINQNNDNITKITSNNTKTGDLLLTKQVDNCGNNSHHNNNNNNTNTNNTDIFVYNNNNDDIVDVNGSTTRNSSNSTSICAITPITHTNTSTNRSTITNDTMMITNNENDDDDHDHFDESVRVSKPVNMKHQQLSSASSSASTSSSSSSSSSSGSSSSTISVEYNNIIPTTKKYSTQKEGENHKPTENYYDRGEREFSCAQTFDAIVCGANTAHVLFDLNSSESSLVINGDACGTTTTTTNNLKFSNNIHTNCQIDSKYTDVSNNRDEKTVNNVKINLKKNTMRLNIPAPSTAASTTTTVITQEGGGGSCSSIGCNSSVGGNIIRQSHTSSMYVNAGTIISTTAVAATVTTTTTTTTTPTLTTTGNGYETTTTTTTGIGMGTVLIPGNQPSLTIHVNQSDKNSQKQQDVVNQSSGISIVNCYRAVPVQIVNINNNNNNNNVNFNLNTTNNANNSEVVDLEAIEIDEICNYNKNNGDDDSSSSSTSIIVNNNINKISKKCDSKNKRVIATNNNKNNNICKDEGIHCIPSTSRKLDENEIIVQVFSEPMDIRNIIQPHHQQQQDQIEQSSDHQRKFISTEAQTDDLQSASDVTMIRRCEESARVHVSPSSSRQLRHSNQTNHHHLSPTHQTENAVHVSREQRRRDRRERRQARSARQAHHVHPIPVPLRPGFEILPDILNSHVPPPYTALSLGTTTTMSPTSQPPNSVLVPPPLITPLPLVGPPPVDDGRYSFPLPIIRRSPSERSGKGCCGQWFAGPPLRAVIFVVALGGLACALGGAALGATGLAGPPTSHFTAALLMTGVGMILVTVSGAAWRMTAPGAPQCLGLGSGGDLGRCGRRPCSGRAPHGLLYPEFQHRPPPPSYQASMQEYRLRLLLLDRDRQSGAVRGASPPPTYRSNAGSLLRAPLSTRCNSTTTIAGGPGSEYSLPPSYRAQHNNSSTTVPNTNLNNSRSSSSRPAPLPPVTASPLSSSQPHQQHQQPQQIVDNSSTPTITTAATITTTTITNAVTSTTTTTTAITTGILSGELLNNSIQFHDENESSLSPRNVSDDNEQRRQQQQQQQSNTNSNNYTGHHTQQHQHQFQQFYNQRNSIRTNSYPESIDQYQQQQQHLQMHHHQHHPHNHHHHHHQNLHHHQHHPHNHHNPYQQTNHHNVLVDVVNNSKNSIIFDETVNEQQSLTPSPLPAVVQHSPILSPALPRINTTTSSSTSEIQQKIDNFFGRKNNSDNNSDITSAGIDDNHIIDNDTYARKDLVTIVTISGCTETESSTGEMDILAHL